MNDTISSQAVIEAVDKYYNDHKYITRSRNTLSAICIDMKNVIKDLPSAQPERKKGHWTEANTHTFGIYECDVCKGWTYIPNKPSEYNFCPRCGADMREGEDDG